MQTESKNARKRREREEGAGATLDTPEGQDGDLAASEGVATAPLTLGRIVHFNLGWADGPILRPAIALDETTLHVFMAPADFPFAPGTGLKIDLYTRGVIRENAVEGEGMGEWRWPEYSHFSALLSSTDE